MALLIGVNEDDALLLQLKEAGDSVLTAHSPSKPLVKGGERVVDGQRRLQTVSDPLLGWTKFDGHDYYVRQLRDMKGSIEAERLSATGLRDYGRLCGGLLAKAHARTSDAAAIAGYCGSGGAFDEAIGAFAVAYADQAERDHAALVAAIDDGRIDAVGGV